MSPVREVSNRGRRNAIGRFPSLKMKRMIQFESYLELDFIHLLEYDSKVTWFEEQPIEITYEYEGKIHHYIPDFHILKDGHNWLVECKPSRFVSTDENQRKVAAAQAWCEENGWSFYVVTEAEIRFGHRLQNVKFLLDYARYNIHSDLRTRIYTVLRQTKGPLSINELSRKVDARDRQAVLITIYHMAFRHEIEIPIDSAPISTNSTVSL